MKTKALIGAIIACAFLAGEVQAGAGEAGTAPGSSKTSHDKAKANKSGGGFWSYFYGGVGRPSQGQDNNPSSWQGSGQMGSGRTGQDR